MSEKQACIKLNPDTQSFIKAYDYIGWPKVYNMEKHTQWTQIMLYI